jgi:hypothetical protein
MKYHKIPDISKMFLLFLKLYFLNSMVLNSAWHGGSTWDLIDPWLESGWIKEKIEEEKTWRVDPATWLI